MGGLKWGAIPFVCAVFSIVGCWNQPNMPSQREVMITKAKASPIYTAEEWHIESFDGRVVEAKISPSTTRHYVTGICKVLVGKLESLDVQMQTSSPPPGFSPVRSSGGDVKWRQGRVLNLPVWRIDNVADGDRMVVNIGVLVRPETVNGIDPRHFLLDKQITDVKNNVMTFEGHVDFPDRAGRYIVELHAYERRESIAEMAGGVLDLGVGELLGKRIVEILESDHKTSDYTLHGHE